MNGRYFPSFEPQNEDMYITLATRRDQVDFINEKKLAELPGEEYVSVERSRGFSGILTTYPAEFIHQGTGAGYFIDNDYERRLGERDDRYGIGYR